MSLVVLIWGCGDLGSGVALRLHRAGCQIILAELDQPLMVRRSVSFAQAVYCNKMIVENVTAKLVKSSAEMRQLIAAGEIPVIVDSRLDTAAEINPDVIVDARMLKAEIDRVISDLPVVIGLGPGFTAGVNCHAVIETKRGPYLGRVYWQGSAEADSGLPDKVGIHQQERVLRAPADGEFISKASIGDVCDSGVEIGSVSGVPIRSPFKGLIRGLIADGVRVTRGTKIGDIDPRLDEKLTELVSEKALAIGGGVLEAILSKPNLRKKLSMD